MGNETTAPDFSSHRAARSDRWLAGWLAGCSHGCARSASCAVRQTAAATTAAGGGGGAGCGGAGEVVVLLLLLLFDRHVSYRTTRNTVVQHSSLTRQSV